MPGEPPNNPNELSQADIDAMMSGGGGEAAPAGQSPDETPPQPAAAGESGELSQADIDAMMGGAAADSSQAGTLAAGAAEKDGGAGFSPTDLDTGVAAAGAAAEATAEAPETTAAAANPEDGDFGQSGFSQADIDAVLGGVEAAPAAGSPALSTVNPDGTPKLDSTGKPFDEAAAMMEAAIAEERAAAAARQAAAPPAEAQSPPPPPAGSVPLELPSFAGAVEECSENSLDLLHDVELDVKIELGRAQMLIEDVLKLGEGSVVELDKLAGDPVDVLVNERLVARGEVLILNDSFCVRISEIVAGVGEEQEVV